MKASERATSHKCIVLVDGASADRKKIIRSKNVIDKAKVINDVFKSKKRAVRNDTVRNDTVKNDTVKKDGAKSETIKKVQEVKNESVKKAVKTTDNKKFDKTEIYCGVNYRTELTETKTKEIIKMTRKSDKSSPC